MKKTKADYYDWLMKRHDHIVQEMKGIPKIPLEIQSKSASMAEYDDVNQRKINYYKNLIDQITVETHRILA